MMGKGVQCRVRSFVSLYLCVFVAVVLTTITYSFCFLFSLMKYLPRVMGRIRGPYVWALTDLAQFLLTGCSWLTVVQTSL